jgi:hypothetical protein
MGRRSKGFRTTYRKCVECIAQHSTAAISLSYRLSVADGNSSGIVRMSVSSIPRSLSRLHWNQNTESSNAGMGKVDYVELVAVRNIMSYWYHI